MTEPMSDTEVHAVRRAWDRFGAPKTGGRLLATIDAKDAEIARLRLALEGAHAELERWGWGDFHYGSRGQEQSVVDALAKIDAALGDDEKERAHVSLDRRIVGPDGEMTEPWSSFFARLDAAIAEIRLQRRALDGEEEPTDG